MRCLAFFIIILLTLSACENDLADIEKVMDGLATKQEVMKGVEMLYSDSAVVRVKIRSPKVIRHIDKKEPKQEFLEGMQVDFFTPNKQVSSQLTAKYGVRFDNKNQIIVRDSVIWNSKSGERLETEELIWDENAEKLYTNKYVTIIRPDEIIYGYGFESNQDFTYSKIKAIEGVIKVEDLSKDLQ